MNIQEGFEASSAAERMKEQTSALNEGKIPEDCIRNESGAMSPEQHDINEALLPDDGRRPHPESLAGEATQPERGGMTPTAGDAMKEVESEAASPWSDVESTGENAAIDERGLESVVEDAGQSLEGKNQFYPKAERDLADAGFEVHNENAYTGQSKPDYLAVKDGEAYIGEIKSPRECETSKSGWITDQPNDTERMHAARENARERVAQGTPVDVAAHMAVIDGQIPDYANKVQDGRVRNLPDGINPEGPMKGAYTLPASESGNVESAFKELGKAYDEKLEGVSGSVTYTYSLHS